MHADELRVAVNSILDILNRSEVQTVVRDYRTAAADQRAEATARLARAGAVLREDLQRLDTDQRQVLGILHLDALATPDYWSTLLDTTDPRAMNAELVRLYSRVMFARDHLPRMLELVSPESARSVSPRDTQASAGSEPSSMIDHPPGHGEHRLNIRLTDAGERAADPDRVARAIDAVDMLYSACASMARKPAMDLRLDLVDGIESRDLWFTGERDSISAVIAVLAAIPDVLEELDPDGDIDLDDVVRTLPIFADLQTLGAGGTFGTDDLKDISDTMHQGALLALESGVILLSQPTGTTPAAPPAAKPAEQDTAHAAADAGLSGDEHYAHYLREREALRNADDSPIPGNLVDSSAEDQKRREAVEEMLRSLERARGK